MALGNSFKTPYLCSNRVFYNDSPRSDLVGLSLIAPHARPSFGLAETFLIRPRSPPSHPARRCRRPRSRSHCPLPAASIITPMMLLALTRRVLRQMDFALEPARQLRQLGRSAGVQAQPIVDSDAGLDHGSSRACLVLPARHRHLHHALRRADHGARHKVVQRSRRSTACATASAR